MRNLLNNILTRQKKEKSSILKYSSIVREQQRTLIEALSHKIIKAIIGPRRSGKSTLIHSVLSAADVPYAYLNFEDEALPTDLNFDLVESSLHEIYPNFKVLFFDEIQMFPRWESLLNRLERLGYNLIITGSNSKLLSTELSSSLTGRHQLIEILPFSFQEFKMANEDKKDDTSSLLKSYLESGGFPEVVMKRVNQQNYLRELWDSTILKDIVNRYRIRTSTELRALLNIQRDSMTGLYSNRSLEKALNNQLSIATIGKFLSYGENAYLCFGLQNFSFKSRTRVSSDKKTYLIDNGYYSSMKIGAQSDYGKLLENIVFVDLIRKGFKINLDLFYFKTKQGYEVDFLTIVNGRPDQLIQVSWSIDSSKTFDRELRSLTGAAKELSLQKLKIITFDTKKILEYSDLEIEVVPLEEFLLT